MVIILSRSLATVAIASITSRLGKLIPDYAKWCPKPKLDEQKKVDLTCPAAAAAEPAKLPSVD